MFHERLTYSKMWLSDDRRRQQDNVRKKCSQTLNIYNNKPRAHRLIRLNGHTSNIGNTHHQQLHQLGYYVLRRSTHK
jgi:hypothetical protein